MLAEAKREAERIVKEARERQEQLVSQQEVTRQAERAAEDIIEDARAREREIRLGAEDYADEILNTLEVNLSKFIAAVQRGRERLQGRDEPAEVGLSGLEVIDLARRFGDRVALDGVQLRRRAGSDVRFRRPQRGRQDDDDADHPRRPRRRQRRGPLARRAGRRRRPARASATCRRSAACTRRCGCAPSSSTSPRCTASSGPEHAADRWIERLGLTERAEDRVEELSLGNQQRVQLAAALVHEPELLVLDEPFSGLDPVGVDVLSGVLSEYAATGVPVVFSSHQLELVERICEAVAIIKDGRLVASGTRRGAARGGDGRRARARRRRAGVRRSRRPRARSRPEGDDLRGRRPRRDPRRRPRRRARHVLRFRAARRWPTCSARPSSERVIRLVARREFTERVRERSFMISTGITLGIVVLVLVLPSLLGLRRPDDVHRRRRRRRRAARWPSRRSRWPTSSTSSSRCTTAARPGRDARRRRDPGRQAARRHARQPPAGRQPAARRRRPPAAEGRSRPSRSTPTATPRPAWRSSRS